MAGKEARLAAIDGEMAKASFWEDTRRAQGLVQERAELARTLGTFKDLVRQAEEARLLWEMATEAGDESMTAEIQERLQRAGAALEAFELKVTLSGPQDRKNEPFAKNSRASASARARPSSSRTCRSHTNSKSGWV